MQNTSIIFFVGCLLSNVGSNTADKVAKSIKSASKFIQNTMDALICTKVCIFYGYPFNLNVVHNVSMSVIILFWHRNAKTLVLETVVVVCPTFAEYAFANTRLQIIVGRAGCSVASLKKEGQVQELSDTINAR